MTTHFTPTFVVPARESFYNGSGTRVARTSSDDCWPLRRADGTTWAVTKQGK
jgi:hypothetical protein